MQHLPVPCQSRLVLYASDQVADIVLCSFLVADAVAVKGFIMVMDDCPRVVLDECAADPRLPAL